MRTLEQRRHFKEIEKINKLTKNNHRCGKVKCKMCKPHKIWKNSSKFFNKQQLLENINKLEYLE